MNILKRLTALSIAAVMLLSFSACSKDSPASFAVKTEEGAFAVSADTDNRTLYTSKSRDKLKLVAKSDMTELYFDSSNCTVSVYDTSSGRLWSSLPETDIGEKTSAIAVTVLVKGNSYVLSSQSDSVGFSSALYEEKENGVTVKYSFVRTLEDGTKINISVPVSYTLAEGALSVEADCSDITGENHDSGVVVTHIDILPFFGSDRAKGEGDYILLSDGCGVTLSLSENPDEFENVSLPVYENRNLIGAFGMKRGDSAFVVLIDEGEALARLQARKALSKNGCNAVYAGFEITPTQKKGDEIYVSEKSYTGKLRLLYRFLSYGNADYIGMAGAVRELLIRKGYLLSDRKVEESAYPFNVSVVFRNDIVDSRGRNLSQTLTTYSLAAEMIDSLRAKGIENINVRLKGAIDGTDAENDFSKKPGSKRELENLLSCADGDAVSFYADAPLISVPSGIKSGSPALSLDGEYAMLENRVLQSPDEAKKNIGSLLSCVRTNGVQGICINDAAAAVYGDYSASSFFMRPDTADIISAQVGAASASGKVMVDTGNIYGVKYADMVVNVPSSAGLQSRDLCTRVPFVQAVLHGLIDYSCEPINISENSEKSFLRCIEYGGLPYYEWYTADQSTADKPDKGSYLNCITQAQSQYERAAAAFEDLRDTRITDHYRVKKNVYYTEYGNGTGVYVNYNAEAVSVNGVTVEGMNFLRVN